jgi:hypothetical protein
LNNCKTCGKRVPSGIDFCRSCAEKHLSPKPEGESKPVTEKNGDKILFSDELQDGAFQRGIHWRKNKIGTVFKARQAGVSDEMILRELRLGGITIQKARELMRDSEELLGR